MPLQFTQATKEKAKLRLALFGPSGSGKTYTALRLATGLGGKIAVIDTERGSASKYADRFSFDVLELDAEHRDITTYCAAIKAAQKAGYDNLIIDSLTHAWHELLGEVDKLARSKYKGNTWSAWSEGTPKQRQLVDTILAYEGHVIATMRTKTEWMTEEDPRTGKTKPVRVGLAPEQGKGIEYEFDLLMELTVDHIGTVIKDRTGKYQDAVIEQPGEDLGQSLSAWLGTGSMPEPKPEIKDEDVQPHWIEDAQTRTKFWAAANGLGLSEDDVHAALAVEHMANYTGTREEAWSRLVQFSTETVIGWQNRPKLLEEWFKFLNSLPEGKRPAPNAAITLIVGDGGSIADFNDTLAVAQNIVRAKVEG